MSAQQKLDADRGAHADADQIKMDEAAVDQLNKTLSGLTGVSYHTSKEATAKSAEVIVRRMADDQRKLDMDKGTGASEATLSEDKARLDKDESELHGLTGE